MILEYQEHDLYYSNPLFSGMTHFSLTGSGRTANIVFTWWQAATEQGHNKSYERHRIDLRQGSSPCLVSYRESQGTIQSRLIRLHSWFCSDSVTTQRAPGKLTHDRVPYDSALILLPHREPQRSWRMIQCRKILLWFCYHTESPSKLTQRSNCCDRIEWSSSVWFCSDSVTTQRAPAKLRHNRVPYDSAPILLPRREP